MKLIITVRLQTHEINNYRLPWPGGGNGGHASQKPSTPNCLPGHLHMVPCGSWVRGGRPSSCDFAFVGALEIRSLRVFAGIIMRTQHPWVRKKKNEWWKTPTLEMVFLKNTERKATGNRLSTFPELILMTQIRKADNDVNDSNQSTTFRSRLADKETRSRRSSSSETNEEVDYWNRWKRRDLECI